MTIDPIKLKKKIQPDDIGTKSSTGPVLEGHHYYIHGTRYYMLPLTATSTAYPP